MVKSEAERGEGRNSRSDMKWFGAGGDDGRALSMGHDALAPSAAGRGTQRDAAVADRSVGQRHACASKREKPRNSHAATAETL